MKKKRIFNLFVFAFFMFFSYTLVTHAATDSCILGNETTKDVQGALKIFSIVGPLLMLAYTILDAIKAVNSGGSFHFGDSGDMSSSKLVSRFVKRLIGVLLLFIIPTMINFIFVWSGVWSADGGCKFDDNTVTTARDPEGCYSIAGGYVWGRQSQYGEQGMRVSNDKCGRNEYGGKFECYQCNGDASKKKWKANSDSDSDCGSGYHVISGFTESTCK